MIPSIRTRLLLWMLGGMTLLLAASALAVYGTMRRSLLEGFDQVLLSTARAVANSVEQGNGEIRVDIDEHELPEFTRSLNPDYFQIWLQDGEVLARSQALLGRDLGRFGAQGGEPAFRAVRLPDGSAGRSVGFEFVPGGEDGATGGSSQRSVSLVVARGTTELDAEIAFLGWLLAAACGGTILLTVFVGSVVVRQGLGPLQALAARIAAIRPEDLTAPVEAKRLPAEMRPVVEKLNDLLRRLEAVFRRERAFTADVAHELRTPLAGMRSTLEVSLGQLRAVTDYRQDMQECLEILKRMQSMIDNLLTLARFEAGQMPLRFETIRLADFVDDLLPPFAEQARARGIRVACRIPRELQCRLDRECLAMILSNLFANAAEYADEGGRFEIAADRSPAAVTLRVANTGCRLSCGDAEHVFERFWRGDSSRSDTGIHSGLGLALVQRAVAALGGEVSASVNDGAFSVCLTFQKQGAVS